MQKSIPKRALVAKCSVKGSLVQRHHWQNSFRANGCWQAPKTLPTVSDSQMSNFLEEKLRERDQRAHTHSQKDCQKDPESSRWNSSRCEKVWTRSNRYVFRPARNQLRDVFFDLFLNRQRRVKEMHCARNIRAATRSSDRLASRAAPNEKVCLPKLGKIDARSAPWCLVKGQLEEKPLKQGQNGTNGHRPRKEKESHEAHREEVLIGSDRYCDLRSSPGAKVG